MAFSALFWHPSRGLRVGEAAVPGPVSSDVTFAVINPTTVQDKVADIVSLNASVIIAAETAATSQAQCNANPQFRSRGYTVPHRFHPSTGTPSRRGAALGTAIFSKLPSRGPVTCMPPEVYSSCRMSEAFIRLSMAEIRVLAAYGVLVSQRQLNATTCCLPGFTSAPCRHSCRV